MIQFVQICATLLAKLGFAELFDRLVQLIKKTETKSRESQQR